jgi:hypothetical protein
LGLGIREDELSIWNGTGVLLNRGRFQDDNISVVGYTKRKDALAQSRQVK